MHDNHDIFVQALKDKRKVILTYFSSKHSPNLTRRCVPLQYSTRAAGENSDRYYLWDSEGPVGERVLVLPPSKIALMELSDETFDADKYIIPQRD